jgi:hypothetical protein
VFDVAGTYTVKVRATDASGAYSDASVTVTVTNADGRSATGTGIFRIDPGPTVTSNSPTRGAQGETLDVVVNGTFFDPGAWVDFSGTGITVNSVTGYGTFVTANITIDPGAERTTRLITLTNTDTSAATGGSFDVVPPLTTTVGSLTFSKVTSTGMTVTAAFSDDSNANNSCIISYGSAPDAFMRWTKSGATWRAYCTEVCR